MKVLLVGGTGAIGSSIVKELIGGDNDITITSRKSYESCGRIRYVKGNAKDIYFYKSLLNERYDAILDFMIYSPKEFEERIYDTLNQTNHYFLISSGRVYSDSPNILLTEKSSRLLETVSDLTYLGTQEYALAKAREENVLMDSNYTNWTIIRPYITYSDRRLQLGCYEKENWLWRALQGRTIIMPKDIAEKKTTLTYGGDVSKCIVELIGNSMAMGEIYNVVTNESITWEVILECYLSVLEKHIGQKPKVKYIENSNDLQQICNRYQIKVDRLYNRSYDNSKIKSVNEQIIFKEVTAGLTDCLNTFLENPEWLNINWRYEAFFDRLANEYTPLCQIDGIKNKIKYIKYRFFSR